MKKFVLLGLAALVVLASCKRSVVAPRPTIPMVLNILADTTGLARTKAEAWAQLNEYERMSAEAGFVVKASAIVAPIAHLADGKKKRRRKRQRGHRRKDD